MNRKQALEIPICREFIGPALWKSGPHLAHVFLWSCGTAAMCRIGETRARCVRRVR